MKKYILSTLAILSAAVFTSCDDMLDTDPRVTEMTSATFPGKPADVEAMNTATYSILNAMGGGDADTQNPFYWWEIMSDNCYGSGGLQDNKVKALNNLVEVSTDQYDKPFNLLYGGINRANSIIETIDNVPWKATEMTKRNQLLGEAFFMRGLYTFWLTQLYGDVPLVTSTTLTDEMKTEVSAETAIYPQIFSDFVSGKNLMGNAAFAGSGHANKYVAEAFLARAYMFWAGFYKKAAELKAANPEAVELTVQEGVKEGANKLSKSDVVDAVMDVINNGGYKLCDDYRSLWQYSNSLVWDEAHDGVGHAYAFIADMDRKNCFDQPGMGNGNTEELFQIQFMNASNWNIGGTYSTARMYCNYLSCWWALRCNGDNGDKDHTYPFNEGWGQGTPSVNIWQDWEAYEKTNAVGVVASTGQVGDIRKLGSLIDCDHELASYTYVKDDCEESGYAVKKWCGVCVDACPNKNDSWWTQAPGYESSSLGNSQQGDHFEDFYLMRYADVLLMATELTGEAKYMNQVQARAGVKQTGYSLEAVQNERRWEFAFEGIRFNDMRRWSGKDGGEGCYAAKALQAQNGKVTTVRGSEKWEMTHMTCSWAKRYADTDGFLPKPEYQITLMNGKLTQNKGWDAANAETKFVNQH